MNLMPLPLHEYDGVNQVLHRLRACNGPFLRDMADDHGADPLLLRERHQPNGRFANLAEAAGRGLQIFRSDSLNGIDNQDGRSDLVGLLQNHLEGGFGEQEETIGKRTQSARPGSSLLKRFLAGDIQDDPILLRDLHRRLKEQG